MPIGEIMENNRKRNSNVYALNQPRIRTTRRPIIDDIYPSSADVAPIGTIWCNTSAVDVLILAAINSAGAQWLNLGGGGGGTGVFDSVTATSGNITADVGDIIADVGDITATAGSISAPMGTVSAATDVTFGSLVAGAAGIDILAGDLTLNSLVSGVLLSDGSGAITANNGTNGQLLIGGGAAPIFASISSPLASITVTPGANSLNLEVSNLDQITQWDGDGGSATPALEVITIAGGSNIITSAATTILTIDLDNTISVTGSITSSADELIAGTTVTAGTGLTITTGNADIVLNNLLLPECSTSTQGFINFDGFRHLGKNDDDNIMIGRNAGPSDPTTMSGINNVYIGGDNTGAFDNATTASNNTGMGYASFAKITTGNQNSGIGTSSLTSLTTGSDNTAVGGFQSLVSVTTGDNNVGIGKESLGGITTESSNIGIGFESGNLAVGSSNILLANDGTSENNTIRIGGDGVQLATFISGIYGVTTDSATTASVLISNAPTFNHQFGTISSSERYKQKIQDMGEFSHRLLSCRPVTFNYKIDKGPEKHTHCGMIAEEVQQIMPELVIHDDVGLPMSIAYHEIPVLLLNEMQKLSKTIEELEGRYD